VPHSADFDRGQLGVRQFDTEPAGRKISAVTVGNTVNRPTKPNDIIRTAPSLAFEAQTQSGALIDISEIKRLRLTVIYAETQEKR
jgi:hypothetical protein